MGKMSTANIMDAMKKAKQKTDTLKFAPHPEDLPLDQLQPNPHNKFADQDDTTSIDDIKDNILRVGLINPIAVNHREGVYYIMSGERRFHAIEAIQKDNPEKFSYVRCTVYENLAFAEEMEVLYAANLKVRHYNAAQRLEYFQQLKDILTEEKVAGHYDGPVQADIAAIMGVTDRQARKYDQINQELDDADKQKIKSGELSVDAAAKKAAERRQERKGKNKNTGSASGQRPDVKEQEPKAEQPGTKSDLVSHELPVDAEKPAECTNTSTDNLYQRTYNDVLALMEALKSEDDSGYEEVARLFGKIMHLMRQKGHKLDMGDTESVTGHGET